MHKKVFNALYIINIVAEALFTLVIPAAMLTGCAWLLVTHLALPTWIYAVAITVGLLIGFYMMVKFILTAMAGLERLEAEQKRRDRKTKEKDENG